MHYLQFFERLWLWLSKQFEKPLWWFIDKSWEMERRYHPLYFLARLFEKASWWTIDKMHPKTNPIVKARNKQFDLLWKTISHNKMSICTQFIYARNQLEHLKEKIELFKKSNELTLKTIVFEEDPELLVPIAKRLLLYSDFSVFIPKRWGTKVIDKNSPQGIYLEYWHPGFLRDCNLIALQARELGICIPGYFINIGRSKCSFETKVIMDKESVTLGQIFFINTFESLPIDLLIVPEYKSINKNELNSWLKQCLDNIDALNSNLLLSCPLKKILGTPIEDIPKEWIDPFYYNPFFLASKYGFHFAGNSIGNWLGPGLPNLNKSLSTIQPIISIDLPFLEKVSLDNLIKARVKERESFILFRKALLDAVQQLKHDKNPRKIAKEVKSDIIQPKLDKIERDIKKIAKYKCLRMSTIITVNLALGIFTGNPQLAEILFSAGIALETIDFLKEMKEVKENPVYFLWKIKRLADKHINQTKL